MAPTVVITGGSGFLASHVIRAFLLKKYNVKATVRSEQRGKEVLASHPGFTNQLSYVTIPDIAVDGAFGTSLQGVTGVIHVASPMKLGATDFESELFRPAVDGTLSVLRAVHDSGADVKRVVITSSFASVLDPLQGQRPGFTYTESDWNPMPKEAVLESGNSVLAYLASKTFAERAAFDFVEKNKCNFTISTLLPPFIYGPLIHHVESMQTLNTSANDIYRLFNGSEKEVPPTSFWSFVDVRDLAQVHVLAFEKSAAGGQRYLTASSAYSYQQVVDIIRAKFPNLVDKTPQGDTGATLPPVYHVDTTKARQELGASFRPLEETIVDMVNSLQDLEQGGYRYQM